MCKYSKGQVVWCLIPFSDGKGSKSRPVIIEKAYPDIIGCKYLVIECSSLKDKHLKQQGIIIKETHSEFSNLGFYEDTFITKNKTKISQSFLRPPPGKSDNPMGICNFMDSLS